jgi:predicted signal transduction protein with EAL and GGDEF domain
LCPVIEKIEDLHAITNRITDVFKNPFSIQGTEYFNSVSIGVAVYPVDGENSETLIRNADIAMYLEKSHGKNRCVFYTPDMKSDIIKKLRLTNIMYRALDKNEFFLYYQPQIKTETQAIIGFEALLRWDNDEYGMIPPDVFIPIAEQTGLIRSIGLWVLKTACEQHKKFKNIYDKDFHISVNLSLEQVKDTGIVEKIQKILIDTRLTPEVFKLRSPKVPL